MTQQGTTELRPLLEGALLAAISVVLVLAGVYLPLVGPLLILVWPAPFALAAFRQGLRIGVLTAVVAGIVAGLFVGLLTALSMTIVAGSTGLAFGFAFRRELSATRTLLLTGFVIALALSASVGLGFLVLGVNPLEMYREMMVQSFQFSEAFYGQLGMDEQLRPALDELKRATELIFSTLLPGTVFLAVVAQAWINFAVLGAVFSRLGHQVPELPPFANWQVPYYLVWVFAVGIGAVWLGTIQAVPVLSQLGQNLTYVLSLVFVVQGLSVAYFFLRRWDLPKPVTILICAAALFNSAANRVLFFGGMFEAVIQFRTLVTEREEAEGAPPEPPAES